LVYNTLVYSVEFPNTIFPLNRKTKSVYKLRESYISYK
jgi:hypothetical protein